MPPNLSATPSTLARTALSSRRSMLKVSAFRPRARRFSDEHLDRELEAGGPAEPVLGQRGLLPLAQSHLNLGTQDGSLRAGVLRRQVVGQCVVTDRNGHAFEKGEPDRLHDLDRLGKDRLAIGRLQD